jgi:peptide/nickel transport system substrate-binding protein
MRIKLFRWVAVLSVLAIMLAACAPAQPPAPTAAPPQAPEAAAEPTQAPEVSVEPTTAPAAAASDYINATREETVIFDLWGRVETPELWNPWVPGQYGIQGLDQVLAEPVMLLNYETGKIEPWLAESFTPNATQDVWTLKLHQGITWSDGVPMTADDVIFTVDMLKANAGMTYSAPMTTWVKEMKKLDDLTVEFTLTNPNPRFLLDYFGSKIVANVYPVPKHIWEGKDPMTFTNYDPAQGWPVFSGPYKLVSVTGTDFVYVRDDNWWAAKTGFKSLPAPKKLVWTTSANDEVKVALMADNGLDAMHDITFGAYEALKAKNPNVVVWFDGPPYSWPDPCPRTLSINNALIPWDDKEMRWMLNYVINRDQIVEIAYENTTTKLDAIFPGYAPLNAYMAKLPPEWVKKLWTTDTAKAAEILTAKGYTKNGDYWEKDGKQLALEIQTWEGDSESNRGTDVIVEQLQKFGINATNKITAGGTWSDNLALGSFEAQWGWQTCGSVNEPWASMNSLAGVDVVPVGERALGVTVMGGITGGNPWRWANKEYTDLVTQIGTMPLGDAAIDPLFTRAMEIFYDELPLIPITQAKKILSYNTTYWTNWPTAKNNYIHPPHWWQSTMVMLLNIKPAK